MSGELSSSTLVDSEAEKPASSGYPVSCLLPKKETGCRSFLRKHPRFDGTGVLIAIMDTGVDPAASGLQVTSSGKRKLVEIIDCTGAGDVDTSVVRTVDGDGYLLGLTGRKLRVPDSWTNPTGKYHLGVKNLYELYPKPLLQRVQKEKREKSWDPMHRLTVADISRQIDAFEKEHGLEPTELELKWKKEDVKASDSILKELDEKYNDCGKLMDCIVFNDGKHWRACIDTSCRGNLKECKVLGSFRETNEYARFSETDCLTFSVNFYDNGNRLEIVSTSGSHGTHVASIAAANFPQEPEKNGAAPGAQLISLCIGDNRMGTIETGASLMRAINKCIEWKVDIINFSYSESVSFHEFGAILKSIEEAVYKHNILFVCAASNSGPALSTVHCPGGYLDAVISVGAFASAEMLTEIYAMREACPSLMFSWTSRGPCPDGGLGVSVCAPGAAFTSVPNWTLKGSQLQHGTSMSSPNATGCIACLLSGLKYENVLYSPLSIKRGLENTAKKQDKHEYFSMGYGMIQIDEAFKYMMANYRHLDSEVRYSVTTGGARGIYLRELSQLEKNREFSVNVNPVFHEDADNNNKIDYEKRFILSCQESWVNCPCRFTVSNEDRNFTIKLQLNDLEINKAYFTEITAVDAEHPDIGPLWRFPITVIKPTTVEDKIRHTIRVDELFFKPATTRRHFIHVPEGACWAVLKFQSKDEEKSNQFAFHALQLFPQVSHEAAESYKNVHVPKNGESIQYFNVFDNRTLELCIAKWWSSLGDVVCKFELSFRGLIPLSRSMTMMSCDNVHRINFTSQLLNEYASPVVSLNTLCKPIKPLSRKVSALGPRDLFQDGRQIYQLILTYEFNVSKSCDVTPTFPPLSNYLYENEYNSHIWMVFTKNKQFVFAGEAYPDRYTRKLDEGDYTLLTQIRHESKEMLEKLKDLNAVIQYRLPLTLNLDCYTSWSKAVKRGKKFGMMMVPLNLTVPLFFTSLPQDKLPTFCYNGCYLLGYLTLTKDESAKLVSRFKFKYVINDMVTPQRDQTPKPVPISPDTQANEPAEKKIIDKYEEALRDLKINWMNRLEGDDADNLYVELKSKYESHLPIYLARLRYLTEKGAIKNRMEIIEVANSIIEKVDQNAILESTGVTSDVSPGAENAKKEISSKKSALIESLVAKGTAICDDILLCMDDAPASLCKRISVQSKPNNGQKSLQNRVKTAQKLKAPASDDDSETNGPANIEQNKASETVSDGQTANSDSDGSRDNEPTVAYVDESLKDENATKKADVNENPDENLSINKTPSFNVKDADKVFIDLMKFCEPTDPKAVTFCVKHAVIHGHYGRGLNYLKSISEEKQTKDLELIAIELYEKLGWVHVSNHYRNALLVKYPLSYRPF